MKVLVLGASGMLGHRLLLHFAERGLEVKGTLRQDEAAYRRFGLFPASRCFFGIDLRREGDLQRVLEEFRPQAVVNAAGIVKQREEGKQALPSLEINAVLPHRLAQLCEPLGARIVHMSTDCVFSGARGNYRESDPIDVTDLYGLTKYLGELREGNCLTLRTSIVGPELDRKHGLFEWFLAQQGTVKGFRNAIYTGFSTMEMARILEMLLVKSPDARGLYHVSSEPISKYELLCKIKAQAGLSTEIVPDETFRCDRSLDSTRFREAFGYTPPSWDAMVAELCAQGRTAPQHV